MKLWWKAFCYALENFILEHDLIFTLIIVVSSIALPIAAVFWTWVRILLIIIILCIIIGFIIWIYYYFSTNMKDYIERQKKHR